MMTFTSKQFGKQFILCSRLFSHPHFCSWLLDFQIFQVSKRLIMSERGWYSKLPAMVVVYQHCANWQMGKGMSQLCKRWFSASKSVQNIYKMVRSSLLACPCAKLAAGIPLAMPSKITNSDIPICFQANARSTKIGLRNNSVETQIVPLSPVRRKRSCSAYSWILLTSSPSTPS